MTGSRGSRRVLVTDAGLGSAISIIRSLGRSGWDVVAADSDPHSPGFRSRFTAARVRYPSPESSPDLAVALLARTARERRIDLLIPVTDSVLLPLAAARSHFPRACRLALPDERGLAATHDKAATLELAQTLGVPIPRTRSVTTSEEALDAANDLGWPVVVKPAVSRRYRPGRPVESFNVQYAATATELERQVRGLQGKMSILLQEYLRGEAVGIELLLRRGRAIAAFQHRRIREVPITGGASALRESVAIDVSLLDHASRLLGALEWTGLAMVEFKQTAEGPRLMEVNGRVWGSLPLAVKSGMDFPAKLARLLCEDQPEPPAIETSYAVGVRSRNLELEVIWIASVLAGRRPHALLDIPTRREVIPVIRGLFSRSDHFDILSRDDPGPGLAEIAKIATKLFRKLLAAR